MLLFLLLYKGFKLEYSIKRDNHREIFLHKLKKIQTKEFFSKPSDRFVNREQSWLAFNDRVLEEAENSYHPLLERVKFLSISSSNLDEFFMVRVAGLKDQVRNNIAKVSHDGLTPKQQLVKIKSRADRLVANQQKCWNGLKKELSKEGVRVLKPKDLNKEDKEWLQGYFLTNIFPALSPIAVDPSYAFPFLPNLGMAIALRFKLNGEKKHRQVVIPLPGKLERFVKIGDEGGSFMLLEDVIRLHKESLFAEAHISSFGVIRIIRDSDLEIEDEAEDLVTNFESAVKKRRRGSVIRLRVSASIPSSFRDYLIRALAVSEEDVSEEEGILGLSDVLELYEYDCPNLKFEPYEERFPERITDFGGDCFAAIDKKDIIIHHPYETFDVVVRFLQQAARDPDVVAIKQTLYRTSSDSPIVKALVEAAEAGKSVTVVVELKARFDEEANIRWARDLERAGAQVMFGFSELKTHAKISLVVRREKGDLKSYVHFGTGNYHPLTAKVYADLSYFTCNPDLCLDASYVFNFLTGYSSPENFKKLAVSPHTLRDTVMELITNEIAHAKAGNPANIWAKMNSLVDKEIIDALYLASQAGVSISLVVRGICGLRPGIKGFSDNITVRSIVGRFLEHARIFCFGDGNLLPSENAKIYISSADWMPRNFDARVEIMVPIENPTVHEQVLGQIMLANLHDEKQSWFMKSDGSYSRKPYGEGAFSAHEYFVTNPSLSGRGKALSKAASREQRDKIYRLFSFDKDEK